MTGTPFVHRSPSVTEVIVTFVAALAAVATGVAMLLVYVFGMDEIMVRGVTISLIQYGLVAFMIDVASNFVSGVMQQHSEGLAKIDITSSWIRFVLANVTLAAVVIMLYAGEPNTKKLMSQPFAWALLAALVIWAWLDAFLIRWMKKKRIMAWESYARDDEPATATSTAATVPPVQPTGQTGQPGATAEERRIVRTRHVHEHEHVLVGADGRLYDPSAIPGGWSLAGWLITSDEPTTVSTPTTAQPQQMISLVPPDDGTEIVIRRRRIAPEVVASPPNTGSDANEGDGATA